MASDSGEVATPVSCTMLPSVKLQRYRSNEPYSLRISKNTRALVMAALTFRRLRTMPLSCSNDWSLLSL